MKENQPGNNFKKETFDVSLIQGWRSHYVDLLVSVFAFIGFIGLIASITRFLTVGLLNIFCRTRQRNIAPAFPYQ